MLDQQIALHESNLTGFCTPHVIAVPCCTDFGSESGAVTDRWNEGGQEKPVLMLQAAFKRPSRQSDAHQSPRQSLEWDKVKPEDKTLVHQVRFITWDFFCYCFCSHLRRTLRPTDM